MKKKFYVVWEGIQTGIFENWEDCKKNIHGVKSAKYKSFKTLKEAKKAFESNYFDYAGKEIFESELSEEKLKLIGEPISDSICVDAACSGNPGLLEYQGVDTKTKKTIFKMGPFENGTNNIGEFLALVHGISLLKKNNDHRPIYSDSKIAINWIKKKSISTLLEKNEKNKNLFDLIDRAIFWLKNNSYDNKILKWETKAWGEIPADFGRK